MKPAMERIDVKTDELKQALERSRQAPLEDPDYRKLEAAVDTLDYLTELVADKDTTIRHLRQLLLGPSTEKTRDVLQRAGVETASAMKPEDAERRPKAMRCPDTGATGLRHFVAPGKSISHTRRWRTALVVRSAGKATYTYRRSRMCWCGSSGRRRWPPPSTRSSD